MSNYKKPDTKYKRDSKYIAKHLPLEIKKIAKLAAIEIEIQKQIDDMNEIIKQENILIKEYKDGWRVNSISILRLDKYTYDLKKSLKALLYIKKEIKKKKLVEMLTDTKVQEKISKGQLILNSIITSMKEWTDELNALYSEYEIKKEDNE